MFLPSTRRSLAVVALVLLSALATHAASAAPSSPELTIRYATEPSTGSMVLAAIVVIAARRRARMPRFLRPR